MGIIKSYLYELSQDSCDVSVLEHLMEVSSQVDTAFCEYPLRHLPLIKEIQNEIGASLHLASGSPEHQLADMEIEILHRECCLSGKYPYLKTNRIRFMHPAIHDGVLEIVSGFEVRLPYEDLASVVRGSIYSDRTGKYFLSVDVNQEVMSKHEYCLGITVIDIDQSPYLKDSDGTLYNNTVNYTNLVKRYLNLSKPSVSQGYANRSAELKDTEQRIVNIRMDAFHKLARAYANSGNLILLESRNRPSVKSFDLNKSMYCCNGFVKLLELKCKEKGTPFYTIPSSHVDSLICSQFNIPREGLDSFNQQYPWGRAQALYTLGIDLARKLNTEKKDETTGISKTDKFSELG